MENIDKDHVNSVHSTPRSSITDTISSPRSYGSGSSGASSSNYSFLQRKLKIPPDLKKVDAAMLEAPLVRRPLPQKLTPINSDRNEDHKETERQLDETEDATSSKVTPTHLSGISMERERNGMVREGDSIVRVPHPPAAGKPKDKARKSSRQNSFTSPPSEIKTEIQVATNKSIVDGTQDSPSSGKRGEPLRKSDDEVSLINSYENYLRQLSMKEEEDAGDLEEAQTIQNELIEDISSGSDSESDSSSYSISVSSLSGNDDDDDQATLKTNSNAKTSEDKFEPLYSLPMKSKKTDTTKKTPVASNNSTLNESQKLEMSHKYAVLNESLQGDELRTQSVPDLRTGRSFRTSDTLGYLCPQVLKLKYEERQNTSSPELKQANFNLKYRPLPDIPMQNEKESSFSKTENGDTIYEQIKTKDISEHVSSPSKSKVSFKAIADRVVSLMPRLTTKEARSREMDRYMADIIRYLPDKTLRVYCGTWNMKGIKVVPEKLDDYILPHESEFIQDIYAIGCQEGTPFRKEWEIRLQETLGPTHVLMYSGNFGVLHLSIFVRRELVWFCTGIEQDTTATRIAHKIKTKGAIAVCFNVFGTSLLFINSHFASNQEKLKERVNDYRNICRSLSIPFGEEDNTNRESDVTSRFDRVFWFGDFNFRVGKKRAETDQIFANRSFETQKQRREFIVEELMQHDQLCQLMEKGKIFHGFKEERITFLPTYKFDVNTDNYDTSTKARVPSWTDRILFKSKQPDQIKVAAYNSCTTIKCSDHRPVFCILEAKIEPVMKKVLLPAAMFDRDIYVEANLRRSAPNGSQNASNICTIL